MSWVVVDVVPGVGPEPEDVGTIVTTAANKLQ